MSSKPQESDSEDDLDYSPSVGAGSESSDEDSEPEAKRARTTSPESAAKDKEAKKEAREELWATFQASVSSASSSAQTSECPKKMVKVERRYLFAGENLTEVIEVPENSAEAKKWPLWRPPGCEVSPTSASPDLLQVSSEPNVATPITPVAPTSGKRPGPRKPRTSLPSLPSQKAKKLSTLDKSAMDWRAHINAEQEKSGLKDELEAHRRGGGYLGKVDFLRRVDERKEGAIEANKSSKRRRP